MAHQRQQRKGNQVEGNHGAPKHFISTNEVDRKRRHHKRDQPNHIGMRDPRTLAEHGDEGEQVDRKRHHPQERRRRDVRGQIGGDRDHEARRHRGQRDPAHPLAGTGARNIDGRGRCGGRYRADRQQSGAGEQHREQRETDRPDRCLRLQGQERLDDHGIGEQGRERTEIGRGVEHVRIAGLPVATGGKPALQQRRTRRQREKRQPDRRREQAEQPERRTLRRRNTPTGRDRDRQHHGRYPDQRQMQHGGPQRRQQAIDQMGIGITCQQHRLEEHHRDRPHRRRAAEFRQHHLGKHRLDREQQQRRDEQRRGVKHGHQPDGGRLPVKRGRNPVRSIEERHRNPRHRRWLAR